MKNVVDARDGFSDGLTIQNRPANKLVLQPFQIVLEPGTQIIEDTHVCLALEMFHNMAANEPSSAGNENLHVAIVQVEIAQWPEKHVGFLDQAPRNFRIDCAPIQ